MNIDQLLTKTIEKENIKKIKMSIDKEQNIDYNLVDNVIKQYEYKIQQINNNLTSQKIIISNKENTIYKNNIIINKLNIELNNKNTIIKKMENMDKDRQIIIKNNNLLKTQIINLENYNNYINDLLKKYINIFLFNEFIIYIGICPTFLRYFIVFFTWYLEVI